MANYDDYLQKVHAKWNLSPQILQDVIKEAVNKSPVNIQRIVAGESNEVYDVSFDDRSVIVRVSEKEDDFEDERWAIDRCKKEQVPVPAILLIKHLTDNELPISICVMTKMVGSPMDKSSIAIEKRDPKQLRRLINQAGEYLSRIHSISVTGWGDLDKNGVGEFNTSRELLNVEILNQAEFFKLAQKYQLDAKIFEQIFGIISGRLGLLDEVDPVLNHNDFGPKHMMVEGDELIGIIDFGSVSGNSPINDFAKWEYWFSDVISTAWLKEGYQNQALFEGDFEEELKVLLLSNGLGALWWNHEMGYAEGVRSCFARLQKHIVP